MRRMRDIRQQSPLQNSLDTRDIETIIENDGARIQAIFVELTRDGATNCGAILRYGNSLLDRSSE